MEEEEEEEDPDTAPDGGRGLLGQAELDQRESGLIRKTLEKQQESREASKRERERTKPGIGFWFKGLASRVVRK